MSGSRDITGIWNSNFFLLIFLGLLVLITHGDALTFGFAREDIRLLKGIGNWSFWDQYFYYWRPTWTLWLSLQYTIFGLNPHAMHTVSLILYVANAWLASIVISATGIKRSIAVATVSLWILMAGNTYSCIWISECNDLLAMLFLLLATLAWIFLLKNKKYSLVFAVLACISWSVSTMAKEVGMLWPIGAAAITAYQYKRSGQKICRSWKNCVAIFLPLIFLISYISLKILAQGPTAGIDLFPYNSNDKIVYSCPLMIKLIKMMMHYIEGIFYSYLPLELFLSWTGLIVGTLVGASLILSLAIRNKGRFRPNKPFLSGGLIWILLFSVHTAFNPSVRTEYIATLGTAFIICFLLISTETKKCLVLAILLLAAYTGMHVCLGKQVTEYFSPSSPALISCHSRMIDIPDLSQEKKIYLKNKLWYVDTDMMAKQKDYMYIEKGPWKKFTKVFFRKTVLNNFTENSEKQIPLK
ncbi:MAG: hypothetical protein JW715_01020 [Sedimentisphaerales bacterium]|nr:hypothetical protein [Sedimentisphaerales bacterium]